MFTQPSVNQIASTYKGNPAPLNAKVETDRKQNGGIPKDLRQLMAAYDLSQGRQNMGIQQALQIPTNMPTVAQDVQERARQALQARQMQQAQEMQRKNGMPNMVPPGTPRPPMQAQGLDTLESNVGEEYAHGGIIGNVAHFDNGGKTSRLGDTFKSVKDYISNYIDEAGERRRLGAEAYAAQPGALEQLTREEREKREKKSEALYNQLDNGLPNPYPQGGKAIPGNWDRPTGVDDAAREIGMMLRQTPDALRAEAQAPAVAPTKKVNPNAQPQNRVNVDKAPMPGGLKDLAGIPSDTEALSMLKKEMRRNPEAEGNALRDRFMKEVGSRDLSIYDKTAAELQARKERLNAPKAGYDAMMEYLEQIAQGGGSTWMEAGAKGAAGQKALQKSRLAEQDVLMEKILDLGAKKSEAQYGEKKGMFDMTQREREEVYKKAFDAAKSVDASDNEAKRLAAQAVENEKNRLSNVRVAQIGAQDRDQLMNRAKALMAADPTKKMTLEEAMKRASLAAGAAQLEGTEVRGLQAYNTAEAKLSERYPEWMMRDNPEGRKIRATYDKMSAELKSIHGIPAAGINALPGANPSGTVPAVGTVMEGYKFKGGNPRDQNNWEKV